jgi:antagonist of KipI
LLGSSSTDLRGGFGGFAGRALVAGDRLATGDSTIDADAIRIASWWIDPAPDLDFASPAIIRMLPGCDATSPPDAVFAREWRVATASNRQGLRLEGDAVQPANACERMSEPVAPGTVQLPPDGRPIVLLADAQTHGGYPRIGHAIVADRPRLAQLRPGDALRFVPCTTQQARRLHCEQQQRLARIAFAIGQRLRK